MRALVQGLKINNPRGSKLPNRDDSGLLSTSGSLCVGPAALCLMAGASRNVLSGSEIVDLHLEVRFPLVAWKHEQGKGSGSAARKVMLKTSCPE